MAGRNIHQVKFIILLGLLFCMGSSLAQDPSGIPITRAFDKLEDHHRVKLFYLPEMVDTVMTSGISEHVSLEKDLQRLLGNKYLDYLIYSGNYVVILKGSRYQEIEYEQSLPEFRVYDRDKIHIFSGQILSVTEEEPLIGATLYIDELDTGTVTGVNGKFSLAIPAGKYHVRVNSVGFIEETTVIELTEDRHMDIELADKVLELSEVIIRDEAEDVNVSDVAVGISRLSNLAIRAQPAFLGEADVVRSLLMLPGVTSVGEASTGINVRGGSADQNLFLYDDAPVFNTSHLFGLFSAFNNDMINQVTLMRAGIPAKYGGRLSSVVEVKSRESLVDQFMLNGGIGLVSSRLAAEVPLWKDHMSFIAGGRTSYSDFLLGFFPDNNISNSSAFFYDANFKLNYRIGPKNTLLLSLYSSYDDFSLPSDTTYNWGTRNASLRWNHLFGEDLVGNFVLAFSDYDYGIAGDKKPYNFDWKAGINYKNIKTDFIYLGRDRHRLEFGGGVIWYILGQGDLIPGPESALNEKRIEAEHSRESAVYVNDEFTISEKLKLMVGLRYTMYELIGPKTINFYEGGMPRSESNIVRSEFFSDGRVIERYHGFSPRISLRIGINDKSSVKLSYNRLNQFLYLVSNTTTITPVDIWKSSDPYMEPQRGDQYALGYFRNFFSNTIETSAEIYYKNLDNIVDYKDGAVLFLNPFLEADLLQGEGRAYGIELMARKKIGILTGWFSYAYSRTERKINGISDIETINNGQYYPSSFDKPHDLKLSSILKLSRRWSISGNFIYSSGRPATFPSGKYEINKFTLADFAVRNQHRIPDYHRLDLAITFEGTNIRNKRWVSSWTLSVFNVYSRENAYSVFFQPKPGSRLPQAYKLSILGAAFPALTYNFTFK